MNGTPFFKMSGSGNDFVVFDVRDGMPGDLDTVSSITRLCARGTGVGADGVVFIEKSASELFRMRYHNADGSRSELCGNATLCSARLAVELGLASRGEEFRFDSDSGPVAARVDGDRPRVDFAPVTEVEPAARAVEARPGEERIGFARSGVPHLVVACADVDHADVLGRGAELRHHPSLRDGANVDFVSPRRGGGGWRYRTFERGVEDETLACGTGAVATAVMLVEWEKAPAAVDLETRSGEILSVALRKYGGQWVPSLRGAARIVYEGVLREI